MRCSDRTATHSSHRGHVGGCLQCGGKVVRGSTDALVRDVGGRTSCNHGPAGVARAGFKIDHVIGHRDNAHVQLRGDDRVARIEQRFVLAMVPRSGARTTTTHTSIEGEWDEVMPVIKAACDAVAAHSPRVSLVLKADLRPGYEGQLSAKVERVEERLRGEGSPQ